MADEPRLTAWLEGEALILKSGAVLVLVVVVVVLVVVGAVVVVAVLVVVVVVGVLVVVVPEFARGPHPEHGLPDWSVKSFCARLT